MPRKPTAPHATAAPITPAEQGDLLIYEAEDGTVHLEVRLHNETLWLTQSDMAQLFQCSADNISLHLKNIFDEGELSREATTEESSVVRQEGSRQVRRTRTFYNLDAVISVGYRIKSHIATRFRIWATQQLREYIIKGFLLDDARFKNAEESRYFDELLARIRDIRSSEKVFWRKVLDIYATSIDYDPGAETTRKFFQTIQNKMHWAAHGSTAAEIIYSRVSAAHPTLGMSNWAGKRISKSETGIAKNYLTEQELELLNRIVTLYLDFAELQALQHTPMTMRDWIARLDDFLKLSGRDLLTHAGKISHDAALHKAHEEFEKYRASQLEAPTQAEKHFLEAEAKIKALPAPPSRPDK